MPETSPLPLMRRVRAQLSLHLMAVSEKHGPLYQGTALVLVIASTPRDWVRVTIVLTGPHAMRLVPRGRSPTAGAAAAPSPTAAGAGAGARGVPKQGPSMAARDCEGRMMSA